jgi:hypothetical protein
MPLRTLLSDHSRVRSTGSVFPLRRVRAILATNCSLAGVSRPLASGLAATRWVTSCHRANSECFDKLVNEWSLGSGADIGALIYTVAHDVDRHDSESSAARRRALPH